MQTLREVLLTPTHRGVQLVRCETGDDSRALALPIGAAVRSGRSSDDDDASLLLPSQIHVRGRVDYHTTLWVAHTFVFDAACADARVLYSVPRTRMAAPPCYTPGTLYPPHAVVQHHDTVYENSSSCDVHAAPGQTVAWVRWGSVEELTQRVPPPLSCTRALAFVGSACRSDGADADIAPAAATATPRTPGSAAAIDCALVHDHDEEGYCCRVGDVPAHTTVHVLWELRGLTTHGHVAILAPAMCQRPCELHVHLTSAAPPATTVPVDPSAISEALILPRIQANHAVLWWSPPLGRYQDGSARGSVEVPAVEAQIGEALWGTARIIAPPSRQSHDHHYWSWHCRGPAHVKTEIHVKAALHRPYLTQHLQLPLPANVTVGHVHTPSAAARFTIQHGHVLASSLPITLITRQHKASEWFSYAACTETFAVPGVRGPLTLWIVHYTGDAMPVLSWGSETASETADDEDWETPILTTRPSWQELRVACARHAQHVRRMGSDLLREGGGARSLLMLVANDTAPGDEPWHALATQMIMEWRLAMHAVRSADTPLLHQILQLLAHMTGIPHDRDQYPVRASAFPVMDFVRRPPAFRFDVPPPYRGILTPRVAHATPYGTCSLRELRKRKSTQHMGPYAQEMRTALTQLLIETDADVKMEHTMEDQLRAQLHETYASANHHVA